MMSHKKFGPDRFSRFDVYWIQTNKQTNKQTDRQTDKPNLYIEVRNKHVVVLYRNYKVLGCKITKDVTTLENVLNKFQICLVLSVSSKS